MKGILQILSFSIKKTVADDKIGKESITFKELIFDGDKFHQFHEFFHKN